MIPIFPILLHDNNKSNTDDAKVPIELVLDERLSF